MKTKKIAARFFSDPGINKRRGNATVVAIIIVLVAMSSSVITWMYAKNFQSQGIPVSEGNEKTSVILTENASSMNALTSGVFYDKSFAGTKLVGSDNQVVLVDSGKEFLVDQSVDPVAARVKNADSDEGAKFGNLQFSDKGRFLSYDYSGWDVAGTKVYDVKEKKSVKAVNDVSDGSSVAFSKDDKHILVWLAATDIDPVKVYAFNTQSWTRTDVLGNDAESKKFIDVDIEYDPERDVIMIELYGTDEDPDDTRALEYGLENGELKIVE